MYEELSRDSIIRNGKKKKKEGKGTRVTDNKGTKKQGAGLKHS